ncbi:GntR family transcriptional regulator [Romboutsia sp. Marseille-P6047]|uniref:GntR family transcriptional regulator n=1 Tax=Romboutsia sp. Marseille-P6047 TaxID=2161817 RepID=UPI001FAACF92|nr:GntR family transcriptional regulator [Romboutsia sp. Marseille-P6047]
MFTKIDNEDPRSIREVVLDELRNAIFENRLKEGDRLVENIIASSMGVSRTPVREALRQLEIEGLATSIPRKGTIVIGISIEDALEIYDLREVLEGLAARLACLNISRLDIRRLRDIIEEMEESIEDAQRVEDLHVKFNTILLHSSKNKRLINQIEHMFEYLKSLRKISLSTVETRRIAFEEHKKIMSAIENGNESLAEEEARNHISKAKERFMARYKNQLSEVF